MTTVHGIVRVTCFNHLRIFKILEKIFEVDFNVIVVYSFLLHEREGFV